MTEERKTRKVKLFTLVGYSNRDPKSILDMDSRQTHACVLNQIEERFGERPAWWIVTDDSTIKSPNYPKFYAAGWLISTEPLIDTKGIGSELLILTHGNSMELANTNLTFAINRLSWDTLAKNI